MELDTYLAAHHRVVDAVTLRRFGYTDRFADARVAGDGGSGCTAGSCAHTPAR